MFNPQPPVINEPEFFPFPDYQVLKLDNGIDVHVLPFNNLDYTNILLSVKSGTQVQSKMLQAATTNRMLREGCDGYDSEKLAEELDYYGTTYRAATSTLCSEVIMSAVSKHLPKMLPLLHNIVFSPTFPSKEFGISCEIGKQNLIHSMQEVSYMSNRQLKVMLFGENHVYAKAADPEDYDCVTIDDLRDYHSRFYLPNNVEFFISGKLTDVEFNLLNDIYGKMPCPRILIPQPEEPQPETCSDVRRLIEKDGCLQSAVSMGCITIGQQHPDYLKLRLLISVLGGYFGSRLMSNIREEKGYTYGIYAQLVAYTNFSTIVISSQTATEYTNALIEEVYKEIDRLLTEPIPSEELEMVKRYYTGMYLQQVSKGIDLISDYRVKVLNNVDTKTYYQQWWDVLHNTSSEELLQIAKKYLKPADFRVSIAGKC